MTESKFKAMLLKDLRAKGHFLQAVENVLGRGTPDVAWPVYGNTIWLELKSTATTTCYLRKEQYVWHRNATAPGRNAPVLTVQMVDNLKGRVIRIMGIRGAVALKKKGYRLAELLWTGSYEEFIAQPLECCAAALQQAVAPLESES